MRHQETLDKLTQFRVESPKVIRPGLLRTLLGLALSFQLGSAGGADRTDVGRRHHGHVRNPPSPGFANAG